jgi:hypothetical protein
LILDFQACCFRPATADVVWREWEGVYAIFCTRDESTHFIDPISSAVFDRLRSSSEPLSFDNLVTFVLSECGEEVEVDQISRMLEERLPQLQRIGIVEAISKPQI